MRSFLLLILVGTLFNSCAWVQTQTVFWKTYQHPTYRYILKHPRSWVLQEDVSISSQLMILPSDKDLMFQANGSLIVQPQTEKLTLVQRADLAEKQLFQLIQEYTVLSKAPIPFGNIQGFEIRAQYNALNDIRILRTFLASHQDMEYVLTFSYRKDSESTYDPILQKIISSIVITLQ